MIILIIFFTFVALLSKGRSTFGISGKFQRRQSSMQIKIKDWDLRAKLSHEITRPRLIESKNLAKSINKWTKHTCQARNQDFLWGCPGAVFHFHPPWVTSISPETETITQFSPNSRTWSLRDFYTWRQIFKSIEPTVTKEPVTQVG